MKKALTIFALLISGVAMGQGLSVNKVGVNAFYDTTYKLKVNTSLHEQLEYQEKQLKLSKPQKIGIRTVVPLHMFVIAGENKTLNLDFKGDSLVVSGNMKLSESGKLFIDYCRKYMKTKIDSLETELQKCNEIRGKANYVTRMGNSSIYDYTTPIVSTDPLISDVEPIGITNIDFLTFQMLLDYEKHCYNDSTKVRTHKEYVGGFCITYNAGECAIPEHYENIWIHKEATLKGFIKWYKEKK